jgi:hypothetical protein
MLGNYIMLKESIYIENIRGTIASAILYKEFANEPNFSIKDSKAYSLLNSFDKKVIEIGFMLHNNQKNVEEIADKGDTNTALVIYERFFEHNDRWLKQLFPLTNDKNGLLHTDIYAILNDKKYKSLRRQLKHLSDVFNY